MTTKDEALRLALEALEEAVNYTSSPSWSPSMTEECNAAATACREALAQPAGERGELVQDIHLIQTKMVGSMLFDHTDVAVLSKAAALLSSDAQPSEWVGLTEDEANALWESTDSDWELMKRTEKFLREKNAGKPDAKGAPKGCHRSHPHENMNEVCELKSQIARLEAGIRYRDEVIQQRNTMLSATYAEPAAADKADEAETLRYEVQALEAKVAELREQFAAKDKPGPWKDGDTAKLVNDLRDVAMQFRDAQQLRERIAHIIRPLADLLAEDKTGGEPVAWCVYCDGQFNLNIFRVEAVAHAEKARLDHLYPGYRREVVPIYTRPQQQ